MNCMPTVHKGDALIDLCHEAAKPVLRLMYVMHCVLHTSRGERAMVC